MKLIYMNSKAKMCLNKKAYYTKQKAQIDADKYGLRIYECPICFCWHTTSKENWKDEFITNEAHEKALKTLENKIRRELNEIIKKRNTKINELELIVKRLKCGQVND